MRLFFDHIGPDVESAQWEISGLGLRIGNHAWVLGTMNYRERACFWPMWARVHLTLRHRPHKERTAQWSLFALGRMIFDVGGKEIPTTEIIF